MLDVLRTVSRWIGRVEMALAAAILIGIVLMILVQVALNAGLGNPIAWEQEGGAYALVWLTFLGASIGLKQMRHVKVVSFVGHLPPRAREAVRAAVHAGVVWTLWTLLRELGPIMEIESRSTTIALPIDLPRSTFFSLPLMLASGSMLLTATLHFIEAVGRAVSPAPDDPREADDRSMES